MTTSIRIQFQIAARLPPQRLSWHSLAPWRVVSWISFRSWLMTLDTSVSMRFHVSMTCRTLWLRGLHKCPMSRSPTNRQTGKRNGQRWTYEDRQDISLQFTSCMFIVSYGIHAWSCPPCSVKDWWIACALAAKCWGHAHLYHSFDSHSRSGCITYIEQQRLSWSCHCFGQSKIEAASKLTLAVRLDKKHTRQQKQKNFTNCQWFSEIRNGISHIGHTAQPVQLHLSPSCRRSPSSRKSTNDSKPQTTRISQWTHLIPQCSSSTRARPAKDRFSCSHNDGIQVVKKATWT